jgi:hypothetical protein
VAIESTDESDFEGPYIPMGDPEPLNVGVRSIVEGEGEGSAGSLFSEWNAALPVGSTQICYWYYEGEPETSGHPGF